MFKAIYKVLFSRLFTVGLLIAIQLAWLILALEYIDYYAPIMTIVMRVIAVIIVFFLLGYNIDSGFKMTWIIFILISPIIGVGIFILFGNTKRLSRRIRHIKKVYKDTNHLYGEHGNYSDYGIHSPLISKEVAYLDNRGFLTYRETASQYYPSGEEFKEALLLDLEAAKSFIFLEYFIIKPGVFWDSILEVLTRKASQGLDVRVMYDDFGCALDLPRKYSAQLEALGIKVVVFNQLSPFFSTHLQNRDHRKICVIDGDIAFTGGINLGDEYINVEKRFGHWKDVAVKVMGPGVWTFTLMFLQNWNTHKQHDEDFEIYCPSSHIKGSIIDNGFVTPYGNSPMDNEPTGRNVYINIINQANKYLYATTPYLILDNDTKDALILASKNGIDVRIITPGIYDKKIVSLLTKDNYRDLLEAGVKIYEYTPGFIHAKIMVSDDMTCALGTVNLDYRSFYHHFENGVVISNCMTVNYVFNDFLETMRVSKEITIEEIKSTNIFKKVFVLFLRLIAPLL